MSVGLGYIQLTKKHFWIYFRSIERSRPSTQTDLAESREREREKERKEIARETLDRALRLAIFALSHSPLFALDDEEDDDGDNDKDDEGQSIRHFIKRLISRRDFIPSQVA